MKTIDYIKQYYIKDNIIYLTHTPEERAELINKGFTKILCQKVKYKKVPVIDYATKEIVL